MNTAESYDKEGLTTYIKDQERVHETLEQKVKTVNNKGKLFTHPSEEAEEICTTERKAYYNSKEKIKVQDTTEQRRKRGFSEMNLTEPLREFINHRFTKLKTQVAHTPATNVTSRKDATKQADSG